MSIGALFDAAARDYDRARRQLVPGFESVRCAYEDHHFVVYGGRKGRENTGKGKDDSG